MEKMSCTMARANLAQTIDKVIAKRVPIVIAWKSEAVVMMPLNECKALAETCIGSNIHIIPGDLWR